MYSSENSYEQILNRILNKESLANVDKRVGSIIYDAVAPVCMELAEAYVQLDILESGTFLQSATGSLLEKRVWDYGLTRQEATNAQRIATFYKYKRDSTGGFEKDSNGNKILEDMDIPEGTRFALPDDSTCTYEYIGKFTLKSGSDTTVVKVVECEQTGTKGNAYLGQILPLMPVANLIKAQITGTYKPAEDTETDAALKLRALEKLNTVAFAGNIPDYIEKVNAMDGVGQTKVFPAWIHNGSVLLSVVDGEYNPCTKEFLQKIKDEVDPEYVNGVKTSGQGIGIAPIGHYVTVGTPKKLWLKVKIQLSSSKSFVAIQDDVEAAVKEYVDSVRKEFVQNNTLVVRRAMIVNAVMALPNVLNVNVESIMIDSGEGYKASDLRLADTDRLEASDVDENGVITKHFLPYLSEVELTEEEAVYDD